MDEVFKDLSPWHHLIFCEELLNNDGENDFFCSRCKKSVLGCPAYKCLECNFLQHESCPESQYEEMDECWELGRHHLIFVEEVDNGGKEEVVCPGCQEPAFGPAYKCSMPECTFFLHKSCTELSHVIQHPMHPEHTLFLRKPSWNHCDVCRKDCSRSIFYRCSPCDFDIDIKCVSRWVHKRVREMEEVFEYLSPWHHLIFCEELLTNDGEIDVVCEWCYESVLGCPAYKCLECNIFQHHQSCHESTYHETHHLIMVEELDYGGKEEVVCRGCQEPAFGPAYKCSTPKCTFFLHKLCTELSHVIHHPVHPKHFLFLQKPASYKTCNACGENCRRSLFYRCSLCDFNLDVICASCWRINADDCHQHIFVPISTQIQFTCQACGEEKEPKNNACLCTICRLLIHGLCTRYPRSIKTITHDHLLTLTYSLREVKKQDNVLCKLCYKKINTEYAAYYDQKRGYIAHLNCAFRVQDSRATTESVACNSVGYESHLVHLVEGINLTEDERDGLREIEHFSHPQHNLILSIEELKEDERCEACMQFVISVPFYRCAQCSFFLHYRCTKLPRTIKRGRFHHHSLTLLSQQDLDAESGLFLCSGCGRYHHGFYYQCDECERYKLDIQCCLIPEMIEHEGHQHSLYLVIYSYPETCNGCGQGGVNFRCTDCNDFALCFRCATLPFVAKYEYDTHLLKLSSKREDDFGEYYCLICEEERDYPDHWFYYCVKCKFTAHSRCVLGENPCINYGRTFTHKDHEHPLTIVQKSKHSPPCDECGWSFRDIAVECTQCKFIVHYKYCLEDLCKKVLKNSLLN